MLRVRALTPRACSWLARCGRLTAVRRAIAGGQIDPKLLLDQEKVLLEVEAIGARELFKGRFKSVDAYLKLRMGTTVHQTVTTPRSTDPVWGSKHVFDFSSDTDQLMAEVWDAEVFGNDMLLGVCRTSIGEIRKAQAEAEALGKRDVETFFHLLPPDSTSSTWVSSVIERTVKAGTEAVGGVSNMWRTTSAKPAQTPPLTSGTEQSGAAAAPPVAPQSAPAPVELLPQGRLYLRLRLAKLKDLHTELPHVVPPAAVPLDEIRRAPKKTNAEWAIGPKPPNRMFRIISLDGGGVRGVLTAGVLRRLVKANRFPTLLQDADLIAGTSTGGILALLFAAGYTPAQAQALYIHHCPKIFTSTPARRYSPFNAKYTSTYLESVMRSYFQDLRIDDLPNPVMVTAFKIRSDPKDRTQTFFPSHGSSWRPALFSNIPQYNGHVGPDSSLCADVACRTSAAPTYFPSFQDYTDGGLFANNPVLCAISKAASHFPHVQPGRIAVLSIGAGKFDYFVPEEKAAAKGATKDGAGLDWGLRQWAPYLRAILLDSSAISLDTNMQLLLGDRYCRVDPPLEQDVDLDDFESIPSLMRTSRSFPLEPVEDWIRRVYYHTNYDEAG